MVHVSLPTEGGGKLGRDKHTAGGRSPFTSVPKTDEPEWKQMPSCLDWGAKLARHRAKGVSPASPWETSGEDVWPGERSASQANPECRGLITCPLGNHSIHASTCCFPSFCSFRGEKPMWGRKDC